MIFFFGVLDLLIEMDKRDDKMDGFLSNIFSPTLKKSLLLYSLMNKMMLFLKVRLFGREGNWEELLGWWNAR